MTKFKDIFENKKILVTGGTGSIGSEIVRRLLKYKLEVVRILSNDENAIFQMHQELGDRKDIRFLIGDIRDRERVNRAMEGIDIVYHAAALKHVPLCEYNPFEAIKTNVFGTQNVIEAALDAEIKKFINISTDKAVNPVNTMGATKLLSEKLTIDANFYKGWKKTIFTCVRFGNVAQSRGSVIPLFEKQIKNGGPITITNPNMTRFIMPVSNTVDLLFKAIKMAKGGEIFILKMPVVKIGDLADFMIEEFAPKYGLKPKDIKKRITGNRLGEKNFEELMTETEAKNALETEEMFIILPQVDIPSRVKFERPGYPNTRRTQLRQYTSKDIQTTTKEGIKKMLFR